MSYRWKILRSAVEQEILFPSEKDYEEYLAKYFIAKEVPFEIVDEKENEDGTMSVVMRKPYNNNEFLRREEEWSDEEFKAFMQEAIKAEVEAITREVEADPRLRDVKVPDDMYDKIMAKIREKEKRDE